MNKILLLFFISFLATLKGYTQNIPPRDSTTYNFTLDYHFKKKPPPTNDLLSQKTYSSDLLPYVRVNIKLLKVYPQDYRVTIVNNFRKKVYNKKVNGPMEIALDLGFAEDIKERLIPYVYYVNFMDKSRNIHSRITIKVEETGKFLVNDKVFGQL